MLSLERPGRRAVCACAQNSRLTVSSSIFESLECRKMFAFGDLDSTWGNKGILKLDQYGGPDEFEDMAVQPNGQLLVYMLSKAWNEEYDDFDSGRMVLKRRTVNGGLDRSFGQSGEVTSYEVGYRFNGTSMHMMGDGGVMLVAHTDSDHDPIPDQLYYVDKNGKPVQLPNQIVWLHNAVIGRSDVGAVLISGQVYDGTDEQGESIYKKILTTWNPATGITADFNLSQQSLMPLSDSTVLVQDWKTNRLTRLASDLKTIVKFGIKDSFQLPTGQQNVAWSFVAENVLLQHQNLIGWTRFFNETIIGRIDTARGEIDRTFGANRINPIGMFSLPFEVDDMTIAEDGSLVYVRTSGNCKVVVGHIARDGMPEATTNTSYNATERVYSPGERVTGAKITSGKGSAVYVAATSYGTDQYGYAYSKDIYVFKVNMPGKQYGTISGQLFNDFNRNGLIDPGDTPIGRRLVFLDNNNNGVLDRGEWSVISDSNGQYRFTGLLTGKYNVRRVLPKGYQVTSTVFSKGSISVTLGKTSIANIGSVKV